MTDGLETEKAVDLSADRVAKRTNGHHKNHDRSAEGICITPEEESVVAGKPARPSGRDRSQLLLFRKSLF